MCGAAWQCGAGSGACDRKLEAQYEALNQKIDRIIAVVEKPAAKAPGEESWRRERGQRQVTKLEKENRELRQRTGRKTLVPLVSTLLAKSGVGEGVQIEIGHAGKGSGTFDD